MAYSEQIPPIEDCLYTSNLCSNLPFLLSITALWQDQELRELFSIRRPKERLGGRFRALSRKTIASFSNVRHDDTMIVPYANNKYNSHMTCFHCMAVASDMVEIDQFDFM